MTIKTSTQTGNCPTHKATSQTRPVHVNTPMQIKESLISPPPSLFSSHPPIVKPVSQSGIEQGLAHPNQTDSIPNCLLPNWVTRPPLCSPARPRLIQVMVWNLASTLSMLPPHFKTTAPQKCFQSSAMFPPFISMTYDIEHMTINGGKEPQIESQHGVLVIFLL
jgi:hypothetical protein